MSQKFVNSYAWLGICPHPMGQAMIQRLENGLVSKVRGLFLSGPAMTHQSIACLPITACLFPMEQATNQKFCKGLVWMVTYPYPLQQALSTFFNCHASASAGRICPMSRWLL